MFTSHITFRFLTLFPITIRKLIAGLYCCDNLPNIKYFVLSVMINESSDLRYVIIKRETHKTCSIMKYEDRVSSSYISLAYGDAVILNSYPAYRLRSTVCISSVQ
jgi:hypothetical protein